MLQGLSALADDPRTRVIVLISKPPAPAIARKILDLAAAAGKPVLIASAYPTLVDDARAGIRFSPGDPAALAAAIVAMAATPM